MPHYKIQITKTQQQVTVFRSLLEFTWFPGSAKGDASGAWMWCKGSSQAEDTLAVRPGHTGQAKGQWTLKARKKRLLAKRQETTSVGEDMVKKEPLCPVGESANWCSHCEAQCGGSSTIKNRITMWSCNSTSERLSKRNENRTLEKYLYHHVHCSIIHNSQDTETT